MSVSTDYSINGDCSVKLVPTLQNYSVIGIEYSFEEGQTYKLEACCLNSVSGASIEIRDSNNSVVERVVLPVTNDFCNYYVEFTATGSESQIIFRSYDSDYPLYIDNIRLTIQ